jgi:outer membrane protein assembly factor BamB
MKTRSAVVLFVGSLGLVLGQSALSSQFLRISTLAGLAGHSGTNDGLGSAARFAAPTGVAMDAQGNIYVADHDSHTIRKIDPAGAVTTLAGAPRTPGSDNGPRNVARFAYPSGVAVDSAGMVYVTDTGNHTIRKVTPAGDVTTLAGTAGADGSSDGTQGDASFRSPTGICIDGAGYLYVSDTDNSTIRKISPSGVVTTLAGWAQNPGDTDALGTSAQFNAPNGIAVDTAGTVYVADTANGKVRKVGPAKLVSTLTVLVDGNRVNASFRNAWGVAVDAAGTVYVSDSLDHTIQTVTAAGIWSTAAGIEGKPGSSDGTANTALFSSPRGMTVGTDGTLVVASTGNRTVRKGVWVGLDQATPGSKLWEFTAAGSLQNSPAIGPDGTVYIASCYFDDSVDKGSVYALDPNTGGLKWEFETGWCIGAAPTIGPDGTVYIGSGTNFYALDGATGALKWVRGQWGTSATAALGPDDTLYIPTLRSLYAVRASNGSQRWVWTKPSNTTYSYGRFPGASVESSPVLDRAGNAYASLNDTNLCAINCVSGTTRWVFPTGGHIFSTPSLSEGGLVFFGSGDGTLYALQASSGQVAWRATNVVTQAAPVVGPGGLLYVTTMDGSLVALDTGTGEKRWEYVPSSYDTDAYGSPTVGTDGTIYYGALMGRLYAVDGTTGTNLWTFDAEDVISCSPVINSNGVIFFYASQWNLGKIIAVKANSAGGLAQTPWPAFMRDARHTGQQPFPPSPTILAQPQDLTSAAGGQAQFSVGVIGSGWLSCSWRKGGLPLPNDGRLLGVTSTNLVIPNLQLSDAGEYSVVVSNAYGSVTSSVVVLTVAAGGNERLLAGSYIMQEDGTDGMNDRTARHLLVFDGHGGATFTNLADSNGSGYSGTDTYLVATNGTLSSHGSVGQITSNGMFFATADTSWADGHISMQLGIKKPSGTSKSTLQGDYIMCEFGMDTDPWTGRLALNFNSTTGASFQTLEDSNGDIVSASKQPYSVNSDGTVSAHGMSGVVSKDGSLFVMSDTVPDGDLSLHLGLRKSSGMSNSRLKGQYQMVEYGAGLGPARWTSRSLLDFDGAGNVTWQPVASSGDLPAPGNGTYNVASDGKLTALGRLGVVSADGSVFALVDTDWDEDGQISLHVGVKQITPVTDPKPPSLTITAPTTGQRVSNAVFTVAGKASDNVGVTNVQVQLNPLNGNSWIQAGTINDWTNWTAQVTLLPGTNVIVARAQDGAGNPSQIVTGRVVYVRPARMSLTITPPSGGKVTGVTNGQWAEINRTYTNTAVPATGFAFKNWAQTTNGVDWLTSTVPKLTFTMQSNLVLVATFVDAQPPALSLTAPTPGQRWSNLVFTVKGKAADNLQVTGVWCQATGPEWVLATTTNRWTNWSADVFLSAGTNQVRAYAVDAAGNRSATNSSKVVLVLPPASGEYLIVTRPLFTNLLGAFITSKRLEGLNVQVATVEAIQTSYPGRDVPERIRNCIKQHYLEHGAKWVFLIGAPDADDAPQGTNAPPPVLAVDKEWELPVRYVYLPVMDDSSHYAPAEAYYSCLDGDWDADGDGQFGEVAVDSGGGVDEVEWVPEVALGRLPARTAQEAADYLAKRLTFDLSARDFSSLSNLQIHCGLGGFLADVNPPGQSLGGTPDFPTVTGQQVNQALNSGNYPLFTFAGDANEYGLGVDDGLWTGSGIETGRVFLAYAAGCNTIPLDRRNDQQPFGAKLLLNRSRGALTYIGAWRLSSAIGQGDLLLDFWRSFYEGTLGRAGEAFQAAQRSYYFRQHFQVSDYYDNYRKDLLIYSLMGDPGQQFGRIPKNGPRIVTVPSVTAVYGLPYSLGGTNRALAVGQGPITWRKISGPAYFSISSDGLVSWTPQFDEPNNGGLPEITIRATDATGSTDLHWVVACGTAIDWGMIVSQPSLAGWVGVPYRYDADNRPELGPANRSAAWKLLVGPSNSSIDSSTGEISWTPTQAGDVEFVLGGYSGPIACLQQFRVRVGVLETNRPRLAITSPAKGTVLSTPVAQVSGTASDNVGVAEVWCRGGAGNSVSAGSANGFTHWTASVSLVPGTNMILAYAVDFSGNKSPTNSVTVVYKLSAQVQLSTSAPGWGSVSGVTNGQWLVLGASYKATALSNGAAGFAFSSWRQTTNNADWLTSSAPALTFTMQSNLQLVANFADVRKPTNAITSPTSAAFYSTSDSQLGLAGAASDNVGVTQVSWSDNHGQSGLATGTASWAINDISLFAGTNLITVTARDAAGNAAADTLTVKYTPPPAPGRLTVTPTQASSDYDGWILLTLTNSAPGESCRIERFIDFNGDGIIDSTDLLVQSFVVTDGQDGQVIGGVVNQNVPGDMDGAADGVTQVYIHSLLQSETCQAVGRYIYRATSLSGGFEPATAIFTVNQPAYPQRVTGQVLGGSTPLANALVFLFRAYGRGVAVAGQTDATGHYSLNCPVDALGLGAIKPGYLLDMTKALVVTPASGATVTKNIILTPASATFSGQVRNGGTGVGIPGVQLRATFYSSTASYMGLGFADASGNFTFPSLPAIVQCEIDCGREPAFYGYVGSRRVRFSGGTGGGHIIPWQPAEALLYGSLANAQARALSGVWVDLNDDGENQVNTTSNPEGNYYAGVSAGSWQISISEDRALALSNYVGQSTSAELNAHDALRQNIMTRPATARLRGRLVDDLGHPVPNISIYYKQYDPDGGTTGFEGGSSSDANGNFDLGVLGGPWYVEISSRNTTSLGLVGAQRYTWDVLDGVDQDGFVFTLKHTTAKITGQVRDQSGHPLAGVELWADADAGSYNYFAHTETDSAGTFQLPVCNGTWHVGVGNAAEMGYQDPGPQTLTISGANRIVNFILTSP